MQRTAGLAQRESISHWMLEAWHAVFAYHSRSRYMTPSILLKTKLRSSMGKAVCPVQRRRHFEVQEDSSIGRDDLLPICNIIH